MEPQTPNPGPVGDSGAEPTPAGSTILPPVAPVGAVSTPTVGRKRSWVALVVVATALVELLGGGYVFSVFLPNRPSAIYATSLERSGRAVDALVAANDEYAKKDYAAYGMDGSMHVKSSSGSMDGTLTGEFDKASNGSLAVKVDIMGEKIDADMRSVHADGSDNPDLYFRVSGVKPLLQSAGMGSLSNLDGQWVALDHTLFDTYAASLGAADAAASSMVVPTDEQTHDALTKAQLVNKDYIFTTDKAKAVLKQTQYVGKEVKDGRSTYHYKMGYDKTNLQAYVTAMGRALDGSKLNDWAESTSDGKKLSEVFGFDELASSMKDAKADYTFDMWVDAETKLIHQLQFTDTSSQHTTYTLAQNYAGGDDYPFALTVSGMVGGKSATTSMKFNVNKKTYKSTGEVLIAVGGTNASFKFSMTPSNKTVHVVAPSGAMSMLSLMNQLGLSSTGATNFNSGLSDLPLNGLMSL